MSRNSKEKQTASTKRNGQTRQVDSPIIKYWVDLLKETSSELPEELDDLDALLETVEDSLRTVLEDNKLEEEEDDPFDLTDEELDEEVDSESKKLQREERRIIRHQELLEEEQARFKTFKRSREAQEKVEKAEEAERLHAYALAVSSKDASQQRRVPPRILSGLKGKRRRLESDDIGGEPYNPAADKFLQDLLQKLQPVLATLES